MSFDTMKSFSIPSPTSASSRKRRGGFFGGDNDKHASGAVAAGSSSSSSLKIMANSGSAAESQRKEHAHSLDGNPLSITAPDAFLGAFGSGVTTPPTTARTERKIGSYSPQARKLRIQKFHEKRKNRTWKKSIKYDCRKKLADDRPRVKGRFVRVLDPASDGKEDEPTTPTDSSTSKVLSGFPSPQSPSSALVAPSEASQLTMEAGLAASVHEPLVSAPASTAATASAS